MPRRFFKALVYCAVLFSCTIVRAESKTAVLLSSHGDIDEVSELHDYIEKSFERNVGIPLPIWTRAPFSHLAFKLTEHLLLREYRKIGPTYYRTNTQKQLDAIKAQAQLRGIELYTYMGFNFAQPLLEDTLYKMQKDGINKIILFNQGAQFSFASAGENIEELIRHLHDHPEWDVEVVAYMQYSDDPRFRSLLANAIRHDAQVQLSEFSPAETCVLVASHGLPQWLINKKDPAIKLMRSACAALKDLLPEYHLYHGYLNDDFIPGAKWVSPDAETVADYLSTSAPWCKAFIMDGRLSFTTHHRATYYDLNVKVREKLENSPSKPKVILAPNFDSNVEFADYLVDLVGEAFNAEGPVVFLKKFGQKPLPKGSIGTPGLETGF